MGVYKAVFGHVGDVVPGVHFESRAAVRAAGLTKELVAGISWGVDDEGRQVADAIVLNDGYIDDVDNWNEIVYTGAGGQKGNSKRQVEDQTWENRGNASLRMSRIRNLSVRVIRGYKGVAEYSPIAGYRYDGLYEVLEDWDEAGKEGFRICRFRLRRLEAQVQELTSIEEQVQDLLHHQGVDGGASSDNSDALPGRRTTSISRIIRDTAVSRRVKRLHDFTCQICGLAVSVGGNGESYAEGAHIQALGGPEGGPDVEGNVLCLCPNCHIRLDRGALYLTDYLYVVDRYAADGARREVPLRTVEQHRVQPKFVRAHRHFWGISEA